MKSQLVAAAVKYSLELVCDLVTWLKNGPFTLLFPLFSAPQRCYATEKRRKIDEKLLVFRCCWN